MQDAVFVMVEVAPNGAQKVVEVFEAPSLEMAQEYAAQRNETELDKHLQRFRIADLFLVGYLMRGDDGILHTGF